MKYKLPKSVHNILTISGILLTILGFVVFGIMFILAEINLIPHGPYIGLILYIVLPIPIFTGLILIPLGMYLNRMRMLTKLNEFNFLPVVGIFIIFVSYQGFHYSESTEFCGTLCHEVMQPEFVTYKNSPHARITCVQCHVGSDVDWYARSKISGLYQVYAVITDKFPRPIETPIENLRPARETCEQCHWPEKFFPAREKMFNHFLSDQDNTPWPINMLFKISGESPIETEQTGSHWHINSDIKIDYIATDEKRLEIPWVRLTNLISGEQVVFQSEVSPLSDDEFNDHQIRTMDCMDCHNRPAYIFKSPTDAISEQMVLGAISTSLPEIKTVGIELLAADYSSTDSAAIDIREGIQNYYSENYPDIAEESLFEINNSIDAIRNIYTENFFPQMNAFWRIYPEHKGHFTSPGCFRCHDGQHSSPQGTTISNDCNSCHLILSQGEEYAQYRSEGLPFKHPEDIGEAWKEIPCHECHSTEYQ